MKHTHRLILGFACAAALSSCAHFKPERRLVEEAPLPDTFSIYADGPSNAGAPWWLHLNTPELDALIDQALARGFTIQEAEARLRQAMAQARRDRAALVPDVNLGADASATRRELVEQGGDGTVESYGIGLAVASYELDLWGRVRSLANASGRQAAASREDFRTAAITLSAQVAEAWVRLVAERATQQLLREQTRTNSTVLELLQLRFRNSMSTALAIYQQEQVLRESEAAIPLSEAREAALANQLAILLGRPAGSTLHVAATNLPALPASPSIGIPADLLANRPDIRSAGLRLESADYQLAAARADRLPALRISAGARYEAGTLELLFDNWALNLAGNLTAPLIDGGRRRAEVDRSVAVTDERLVAYRRTVANAFREVEDAVMNETKQAEHIAGLTRQLESATAALDEAQIRYRNGLIDYLPVLTQILSVQRIDRALIAQRVQLGLYRIALCRALGGAWANPDQVLSPDSEGDAQ